ncbi:MAG: hypothetical protein E7668_02820 [Ruminococcaceae bacterium]|nr:hypothetical protein [Oscillospiraceae bacterium]
MSNKNSDLFRRSESLSSRLYVLFAILALAIHVAICTYTGADPAIVGLTMIVLYGLLALIIRGFSSRQIKQYKIESDASEEQNHSVIYAFRNHLRVPYAVVTETGKIVTVNAAMRQAADLQESVFNTDIATLCGHSMEKIVDTAVSFLPAAEEDPAQEQSSAVPKPLVAHLGNGLYQVDCHPLQSKGKPYYMLVFRDVTELTEISERYHDELTAIGYIVLDNLEEIAQYVQVSYQSEAHQVETILKEWAASMGGVLREYDRNKYVLLFTRQMLSTCIKNKFEILDTIREVRIGEDNMPVTVSMGIATTSDTLAGRERDALVALDMALQRGGDQVVLKNEKGNDYFGGRTKSQQKRTRGHSRIIAGRLCSMISGSSNVIVMGHSNPDFDSIGACVGIAALCLHLGVDVKVVTDTECDNFRACTGRLCELDDYKSMFVDGVVGLGESSFGTLLIIVDANNFSILEAPEIADHSFKTAVIDHHIKKEEFENEPQLTYIDPSASSACELISEILEQSLPAGVLRKEEANLMMAGIMVDTKNFTRTVGTRTFAAALYLRGAGASPEYARTFFEEAFEDYRAEAQFGSEAKIYRERIAITSIEGGESGSGRIAAAKAADKLLTVRNVHAAFALIRMGNVVHISARSDGSINVQLILEKIGGGGHFDVAGAAITESELKEAEQMLLQAIDTYFEEKN